MHLRWFRLAVGSVHALTAAGAAAALFALIAISENRIGIALIWMAIGQVIDGVDGPLARAVRIRATLPGIDGTLLDNIVDYLNYVIVPAWLLLRAELLPEPFGLPAAAAVCLASAFQFTRSDAKTADHFFLGFPCYWNVLVLYLLVLPARPWVALALVTLLCALVFVPLRYVYPTRTREYRPLTLALTTLWGLALAVLLLQYPDPAPWLVRASLLYVAYYTALSLVLDARARRGRRGAA